MRVEAYDIVRLSEALNLMSNPVLRTQLQGMLEKMIQVYTYDLDHPEKSYKYTKKDLTKGGCNFKNQGVGSVLDDSTPKI